MLGTYLTELYFEFASPKLSPSREDYCLDHALQLYPETISNLYFNDLGIAKQKSFTTKAEGVFKNLTDAFKEILNKFKLDDGDKRIFEEKLNGLQLHFYDKVIPVSIAVDTRVNTTFDDYWIKSTRSLKERQFYYWNKSYIQSL